MQLQPLMKLLGFLKGIGTSDYRVTEVLYDAGKLTSQSITQSSYKVYMKVIMDICDETGCDIRTLDRALFAYHKGNYK